MSGGWPEWSGEKLHSSTHFWLQIDMSKCMVAFIDWYHDNIDGERTKVKVSVSFLLCVGVTCQCLPRRYIKGRAKHTRTKPNCNLMNIWGHASVSWCSCSCLHWWDDRSAATRTNQKTCSVALLNTWLIYFALSFIYLLGASCSECQSGRSSHPWNITSQTQWWGALHLCGGKWWALIYVRQAGANMVSLTISFYKMWKCFQFLERLRHLRTFKLTLVVWAQNEGVKVDENLA